MHTPHTSQASHALPNSHTPASHVPEPDDSMSFECGACPPVRRFDVSMSIGGDAGQVLSPLNSACRALVRAGHFAFGMADYRSRIRGGTNFYQVRASDAPVLCHGDPVHVIATLTRDAALTQLGNLARRRVGLRRIHQPRGQSQARHSRPYCSNHQDR